VTDPSLDDTPWRAIRALREDVRELRGQLGVAHDRIRALERLRPTCVRCLDATATRRTASGPACDDCAGDVDPAGLAEDGTSERRHILPEDHGRSGGAS